KVQRRCGVGFWLPSLAAVSCCPPATRNSLARVIAVLMSSLWHRQRWLPGLGDRRGGQPDLKSAATTEMQANSREFRQRDEAFGQPRSCGRRIIHHGDPANHEGRSPWAYAPPPRWPFYSASLPNSVERSRACSSDHSARSTSSVCRGDQR